MYAATLRLTAIHILLLHKANESPTTPRLSSQRKRINSGLVYVVPKINITQKGEGRTKPPFMRPPQAYNCRDSENPTINRELSPGDTTVHSTRAFCCPSGSKGPPFPCWVPWGRLVTGRPSSDTTQVVTL